MGIKNAAKKVGKAIIFMKLFEEIKANKEPIEADIAKLKEIIEEFGLDKEKRKILYICRNRIWKKIFRYGYANI